MKKKQNSTMEVSKVDNSLEAIAKNPTLHLARELNLLHLEISELQSMIQKIFDKVHNDIPSADLFNAVQATQRREPLKRDE